MAETIVPDPPPDTDEQTSTTVTQLVYASSATRPFSEAELTELLEKARAKNESLGITGMLLYCDGCFIQAIEGDPEDVDRLYQRISRDRRHANPMLLYKGTQTERSFPTWTMGFHRVGSGGAPAPGLNDFLQRGVLGIRKQDTECIRRILHGFRDGKYRR
ncbi:MAG: BLUF domain-containing protein [Actinomycetota bacterium]